MAQIKGIKTTNKQRYALNELRKPTSNGLIREVVYGGAKGGAKSFLGTIHLHTYCLYPGYSDLSFFVCRKTGKDLIDHTIPTFIKFYQENGLNMSDYCKINHQSRIITFNQTGSKIYLLSSEHLPSDPMYERFGSIEMTGGWMEEAGEQHELAYQNLKLTIGRQHNEKYNIPKSFLITCNPKKNWIYNDFYKPWKEGKLPENKSFIQSFVTDNSFRPAGYENTLDGITNKRDLMRLRYGEWDYDDSDNALMQYEKILDLFSNTHVQRGRIHISCDIAFTNDRAVIVVWSGDVIIDLIVSKNKDAKELTDLIQQTAFKYQCPRSEIYYDGDGIGAYLKGYLKGAKPINNGGSAKSKEYSNVKSELYFKLAELVNQGSIYISCELSQETKSELIEELSLIKYEGGIDGKLSIEKKSKLKEYLKRSPDISDAIMLGMYKKLYAKNPFL